MSGSEVEPHIWKAALAAVRRYFKTWPRDADINEKSFYRTGYIMGYRAGYRLGAAHMRTTINGPWVEPNNKENADES